jgi:hypothetical protein
MALGSDFILSQSMKSQVDYSWSTMRKHVLRQNTDLLLIVDHYPVPQQSTRNKISKK